MRRQVALVIGAGRGVGANVGARFAKEGFTACLVRRSDPDGLNESVSSIRAAGHHAHGFLCDATKEAEINQLVQDVGADIGDISVCIYNLGANMGRRSLAETSPKIFERAWSLGALGGYLAARAVAPGMVARGSGTMIFTGATASLRGNAGQLAHAHGMAARRSVAQSLAHELWPQGVHVAHCTIDGLIDAPDTVGKFFPEMFEKKKAENEPISNIVKPEDVAEHYWHLHSQPRGCWTFETDVRPWKDTAWFNTSPW
jgi:NAD(P)-dependent dehydrogenase (short-subunit alcohol dehydrogenase family)